MTKQAGSVEIISAMIERLPPVGSVWPLEERALWLSAMEAVLHLVYGPVERIDISALIVETPTAEQLDQIVASIAMPNSAEPTDKAMARDVVAAGGSRDVAAETTEAPAKPEMGSEWSSSAEANQVETDAASDEKTPSEPDPPKLPPLKNVGGAPSKTGRPDSMPPNLSCAIEAISLEAALQAAGRRRRKVVPSTPVRAPMPPVQPPAPTLRAFTFKHGDRSVMLASAQQLSIASRLQQALGQHIAEAFLAEKVLGANTERHRELVKAQALGLNGPLFDVGLKVTHYPGFGLIMKEVE